jgi:nucleoside-diphosphate-sugar epimerase
VVVLVTGATGFLGGAVARRLVRRGEPVLATGRRADVGAALAAEGIPFRAARLEATADVAALFARRPGAPPLRAVVHCAALSSPWGRRAAFEAANVTATRNVAEAALASRVERFVHVSTPALYFDGTDRRDVREDASLPPPQSHYARTKLAAERVIDDAVARGLAAVTLRPRALFGPGDTTIFPRLLRALERGRLPIIGDGANRVDLTFIDNAAHAVALALDAEPHVVGRKYNVTNGEPVLLWPLLARLARELGLAPPTRRVSRRAARVVARALELVHTGLGLRREPLLTRYTVGLLAADTTLDIGAARRDLGYEPLIPVEEGVRRFLAAQCAESR